MNPEERKLLIEQLMQLKPDLSPVEASLQVAQLEQQFAPQQEQPPPPDPIMSTEEVAAQAAQPTRAVPPPQMEATQSISHLGTPQYYPDAPEPSASEKIQQLLLEEIQRGPERGILSQLLHPLTGKLAEKGGVLGHIGKILDRPDFAPIALGGFALTQKGAAPGVSSAFDKLRQQSQFSADQRRRKIDTLSGMLTAEQAIEERAATSKYGADVRAATSVTTSRLSNSMSALKVALDEKKFLVADRIAQSIGMLQPGESFAEGQYAFTLDEMGKPVVVPAWTPGAMHDLDELKTLVDMRLRPFNDFTKAMDPKQRLQFLEESMGIGEFGKLTKEQKQQYMISGELPVDRLLGGFRGGLRLALGNGEVKELIPPAEYAPDTGGMVITQGEDGFQISFGADGIKQSQQSGLAKVRAEYESNLMDIETIDRMLPVIDPANLGITGEIRGGVAGLLEQAPSFIAITQELANDFMQNGAGSVIKPGEQVWWPEEKRWDTGERTHSLMRELAQGLIDPEFSRAQMLKTTMIFKYARTMDSDGRLSDQDVARAEDALGAKGWFISGTDFRNRMLELRHHFVRQAESQEHQFRSRMDPLTPLRPIPDAPQVPPNKPVPTPPEGLADPTRPPNQDPNTPVEKPQITLEKLAELWQSDGQEYPWEDWLAIAEQGYTIIE